jgi:hypothetical protein
MIWQDVGFLCMSINYLVHNISIIYFNRRCMDYKDEQRILCIVHEFDTKENVSIDIQNQTLHCM